MQKRGSLLVSLGFLGLSQGLFWPMGVQPVTAATDTPASTPTLQQSEPVQRLMSMFSQQIQTTINACWDQGKVDLEAGAGTNGVVTCGNGTADQRVQFHDYVNTVSDILAASSLVGFRTVIQSDPRITPQSLTIFLADTQGRDILRSTIQSAITQSELLPPSASDSAVVLADEVIDRLVPTLSDPQRFDTLLGTTTQYQQVVNNFCNPPGMSVEEAKHSLPELNSVQLFAICIQESGVTDDVLQVVR